MAGRPSTLRINVTSDSQQARRDLDQMADETESAMSKLGRVGAVGAAAAGALVGAALIGGISDALNREKVGAQTAAALGEGSEAAKKYGKLAGDLWAQGVTEDVATAADAIRQVMSAGILPTGATEAQIKRLSTQVADLSSVFGEDLGATTRAVSQLMRTGLARDAQHALDIIAKGMTSGANRSEDLLDTINEYSTQFRDMGISGEQALGLITQGLEGGARDADIVADAFKELNIRIKDQSAAEAVKKLGLNAEEMARAFTEGGPEANAQLDLLLDKLRAVEDPALRTSLAVQLVGTQAEDLGQALFELDPSEAVAKLGEVNGSATTLGDTLRDNTITNLQTVIRQIQSEIVDAVEEALPYLQKAADMLRDNLDPAAENAAAVLGHIVDILRKLKGPTEDAIKAWQDAGEALGKMNEALGPLSPIIKFLALLTGYGVLLTIQSVGQAIQLIADTIRLMVWPFQQVYDLAVKPGWAGWWDFLKKIGDALKDVVEFLKDIVSFDFDFGDLIPDFIPGVSSLAAPAALSTGGPPGSGAFTTLADGGLPPITLRPRTDITVMIDGTPFRGMVRTEVRSAMQADGARYLAGGWA